MRRDQRVGKVPGKKGPSRGSGRGGLGGGARAKTVCSLCNEAVKAKYKAPDGRTEWVAAGHKMNDQQCPFRALYLMRHHMGTRGIAELKAKCTELGMTHLLTECDRKPKWVISQLFPITISQSSNV